MITCELFDDYIDDELSPKERVDFEKHLSACSECRRDLTTHRCFKRMIAAVRDDITVHDAATIELIQSRVRVQVRRARLFAATKAFAAALFIGLGVWTYLVRDNALRQTLQLPAATPVEADRMVAVDEPRPVVQVDVADDAGYLAVPLETSNPNLTIIWFHPTIDSPQQEPSSALPFEPVNALAQRS
jgi:anti-sigma factor RsiW